MLYRNFRATALPLIAIVLGLAACSHDEQAGDASPTAQVTLVAPANGSLSPIAVAYGVVGSTSRRTRVLAMPFEGSIGTVFVHMGDKVAEGQALYSLVRTPATTAQVAQARSARSYAEEDLKRVERLRAEQLATNEQLAIARRALTDASAQLESLERSGASHDEAQVRAPFDGVLTTLAAVPGDRPTVGAAVATVASPNDLAVQLGLEPGDAAQLKPGARVHLRPPGTDTSIDARLESVGQALDPATRLVHAVAIPEPSGMASLTLGTTVEARIELPGRKGWVVPRDALLEDAAGPYVFTAVKGKSHRAGIKLGAETDEAILATTGLSAGDRVIVVGNAGLEDGVAIAEAGSKGDETKGDESDAKGAAH